MKSETVGWIAGWIFGTCKEKLRTSVIQMRAVYIQTQSINVGRPGISVIVLCRCNFIQDPDPSFRSIN